MVITKLAGPLSSALGHGGDLKGNRDGSRHSSTSSLKSGDDPLIATQSNKGPVMMTGFSSTSSNVITLSPSPTGSLEEGKVGVATIRDGPHPLDQDSDKESDSEFSFYHIMSLELSYITFGCISDNKHTVPK